VTVRQKGPCVTIEFKGDGFLYKMVRLIVGSLVKCAFGKMSTKEIIARLKSPQTGQARFAAPAEGLFLVRVRY
jgi:tRNA pseudouridine38-40 synthase